jgi:nucleotide-binding universal stress UspA family protein
MAIKAVVSYDDTPNDRDALALGRVLAEAGAELTLAYVRHGTRREPDQERLEEHEAEALLERGALALGDPDVDRRVVVSASTTEGLRWLAEREGAQIVVFGSDYRTASGHVSPQKSTEAMLEGGPAAVAIAPADYRDAGASTFGRIGIFAVPGDDDAIETARALAESFGASVTRDEPYVDLLVVGSRSEAPEGHVMISAQAWHAIENATCPVLVLPRGVTIRLPLAIRAY